MKRMGYASAMLLLGLQYSIVAGAQCESEAKLNIRSSNYSGRIDVELRKGTRPGSRVVSRQSVMKLGTVVARNVCPGTYFYAFSTPDSDRVSTTRYFQVENDGYRYSMPVITVTYSRSSEAGTNRVGSARRDEL